MFADIARFETRYQLISPVFIAVFVIFFLLVFAGVTIDQVQIGGGGATNINSPNALTINILIFSLFGGLIPAAFLSSGVLRDQSYKIEELFFSRPISKFSFVLGRFTGGFIATALCFLSVPLAFLIGSQMWAGSGADWPNKSWLVSLSVCCVRPGKHVGCWYHPFFRRRFHSLANGRLGRFSWALSSLSGREHNCWPRADITRTACANGSFRTQHV